MLKIPNYQIHTKIHESANSQVYRGIKESDNLPVICKILQKDYPTPEEITRYKLEYKITSTLSLPNIIKSYDFQELQRNFVIIFEDFGGESLEKILSTSKLTLKDLLEIAIQIAGTLSEIHAANIIHKDINPSNIVLNLDTKQLKIIDFGIATSLPRETLTLKNPTVLEGTLAYISPEQTGRMNRSLDYRTDFYSLGATFYQLLTNRLPFETSDALELIHYHLALEPVPPHEINPEIPPVVSEIVLKLLAKAAEDRYQSAWGIKKDLEHCLTQLQNTGYIDDFPLAQQDIYDKFQIPEKLYGREREVEILLSAFARITGIEEVKPINGMEIVLVAGYSGIGKSALVQEIYKTITHSRGYFIGGKFDQYQRNIPYFAIAQAFNSLIKQLLTESEIQLIAWREKILTALGSNSRVITQVIPALEMIVGNQPDVPILPPTEAQNRFNQVFLKFIYIFTQSEHPLVMFLDDLQWADTASLQLIQLLTTGTSEQSLLLIGAYRDNEVNASHPLIHKVTEIEKTGGIINQIFLSPLNLFAINQLIADTLHCQTEDVLLLAKLVEQKTNGNPFFMNEFLKLLYTENLLKFNRKTANWQWSIQQIRKQGITDNVVELMALKIQSLKIKSQKLLQLSACIGNQFDLETLAFTAELSPQKTAKILQLAIAQGLILPLSNAHKSVQLDVELPSNSPAIEYKFVHDRIQQAAYSLIPENERQIIHWQIGQRLIEMTSPEQLQQNIFNITNQLNLGKKLVKTESEQLNLSRLNLIAGEKAKASAAYEDAWRYLQIGLEMLPTNSWETNYDFTLSLYNAITEAAYLSGNFEQVEPLFQEVCKKAENLLARLKVYDIKIQTYVAQNQFLDGIEISLNLLQQLGIHLPIQPSFEDIQQALSATASKLANRPIEDLIDLPIMSKPEILGAMQLLSSMCASAFLAVPPLFLLIVLKMVDLLVEYGNTMLAPFAYAAYGLILCGIVFDIEAGYQFGKLALILLDKLDAKPIQARTLFPVSNQINVWKIHLKESLKPHQDCYQAGIDQGDLEFAGYAAMHFCGYSFAVNQPLDELKINLNNYAQAVKQIKHSVGIHFIDICWQTVLNLSDKVPNPGILSGQVYDESTRLIQMQEANLHGGLFYFHLNKLFLCYLFEDTNQAIANGAIAKEYLPAMTGAALVAIFRFYDSLSLLAVYADADPQKQSELLQQVAENQEKMQLWAHHAPMNYLHKWYLVEAEKYRVLGDILAAMEAYDQAINLAKENDYLQEKALAKELAGKFYLAQNRIKIAKIYLQDARYCYLQWGAKAKVEDLENRYPQLLQLRSEITEKHKVNTTQSATTKLEVFDLETVLKASQTIASEILLDQLLAKLMTILIENAGAQTGYVILPTEKEWQIAAIGSINNEKVELISADSITTLPTSLINYVARTQENVVLNNAIQEGDFQSEPWIMQNQSKSILCTPLLNQGKLTGIVLLENNLTTNAFTPERIEIINFLSTQAAISINNARLLKQQKELNQSLRLEIDEREKVEQKLIKAETTLQSLVAGTAAVTGQDFFPALVSHIAQALHVTYALVTEAVNGELHALAFWAYGALQPPISYFPARTPCEFALQDGLFLCETLVQRMFPEDLDLVKMQADSYLGISLKNANGDPIGNLCILDLKPLSDIEGIKTILDVFAARATAELERKRANEALYQLNEELEARVIRRTAQLEAANKALESFSYSVSHDLRAPLRAIDGFARMMEEDYSEQLDTEGNRYLKVVRDNAKRMGELIDDLLNLSRMDRKGISKQPVLLNELIRQVLTDLIPENRQIEFEIADLPICEADLSLITQVWINLLSNAIKYTGYQPVAHIQVGYEIINGEGVYFLRDNGSGFDMQYANNLFGVFQRLHREQEFEGTGIGLAIVQRIIQRHGGRIWAEAAVNQGATFYFTLPK